MATLTDADFTTIRDIIRSYPDAKAEFKALSLSKAEWKAAFQAAEDWFVSGFNSVPVTSFKAALEVQTGALTGTQAQLVGFVWMLWRWNNRGVL